MNKPVPIHDSRITDTVWMTLRLVFGLVPIVAGLDKFTNLLVDWSKYLAPFLAHIVPPHTFMILVGVIESLGGLFLGETLGQLCIFLVFILVLLVRPTGLFGARA